MIKDEKDVKPATDQQMIQSTIRKDQRINESTDQRINGSSGSTNGSKYADRQNEERKLPCLLNKVPAWKILFKIPSW